MKKFFLAALALLALAPFSFEAAAQTVVTNPTFTNPCVRQASPLTGCILVDAAHPLPVTASGSPSGTQDVNIKQVNGSDVTSVPINDNAGSLTVDGTVALGAGAATIGAISNTTFAATQSGTWTTLVGGNSFTNITTNTDTVVKASAGTFAGLVINSIGTTSTATVYNNTTCTGTKIGTFSTLIQGSMQVNATASVGICVTTAGAVAADITILWR